MSDFNVKKLFRPLSSKKREDPRLVVALFFQRNDLSEHLWYIDTWLDCVNTNDHWRENCPADLLVYCEELKKLIKAAYVISREKKKPKTALDLLQEKGLDKEKNLLHPALYFGWQPYCTMWDFFPRSLSRGEYINPYQAVSGFFRFKSLEKWHEELYVLLIDGLSGTGVPKGPVNGADLSPVRKSLHKLVEATHLIAVREADTIDGKFLRLRKCPYSLERPYPDVLMAAGD